MFAITLLLLLGHMRTSVSAEVLNILNLWSGTAPIEYFFTVTSVSDLGEPPTATIFERDCYTSESTQVPLRCLPVVFTQGPSTWEYENVGVEGGITASCTFTNNRLPEGTPACYFDPKSSDYSTCTMQGCTMTGIDPALPSGTSFFSDKPMYFFATTATVVARSRPGVGKQSTNPNCSLR